ncbi:hypothetical protein GCM10022226_65010 [Sphaerisporangium flaviroseum]|uniref:Transposase n=1 Tax=Sphaerisporangium flaviroseum TaxID=509199 RepID=A0ABP7J5I6_9ACTN
MDLSAAASELYGGVPEDFVERRKRLAADAKKAGDAGLAKSIAALRRPTVSAWAVNRLAHSAPDELGELLGLGEDLRSAWQSGGRIGELDQRRGELVSRLVRTALSLATEAGRPLREPVTREIEDTLHAATMDSAVAEEVRRGWLAQPRSHAGFVPAGGLAGAGGASGGVSVRPDAGERRVTAKDAGKKRGKGVKKDTAAKQRDRAEEKRREEEQRRRRLAEQAATAAAEVRDAEQVLAEWEAEVEEAGQARTAVTGETQRLRKELKAALDREEAVSKRLSMAERERDRAARKAAEARRRSEELRRKL